MMQGVLNIDLPGMESEAIDYDAIPVNPFSLTYASDYVRSVNGGVETLTNSLKSFLAHCPNTYAILAGFSQGAEVVGTVYARLTDSERRHVASVTLFGDPEFNPLQPALDRGDYSSLLSGINVSVLGDRPQTAPAGWESRMQSYCTRGDPICNYDSRNLLTCNPLIKILTCAHLKYYDRGWTDVAAAWVRHHLGDLPSL